MTSANEPARRRLGLPVAVAVASASAGYVLTRWSTARVDSRMLPWILGRSLGLAAYICLVGLVVLGLCFGRPSRLAGRPRIHPAGVLRLHASLAVAALVSILGHVGALVVDRYALVGMSGALVPGLSGYRPAAVAMGTLGLYAGLVVGISAMLAGGIARRIWLPVHRMAALTVALVWFHAVLAGTDTPGLRWMYILSGTLVLALSLRRHLVPRSAPS